MYTFILLAWLSCGIATDAAIADNKTHLMATVLFYSDKNGDKLVATKYIPIKVEKAIRRDIKHRVENANVRLVPIFYNPHDAPPADQLLGFIKHTYSTLFVTELSHKLIKKIVAAEKKHKTKTTKKDNANSAYRMKNDLGSLNKKEMNAYPLDSHLKIEIEKLKIKKQGNELEKFMPNSVYYAIEEVCKGWTYNCKLLPKNVLYPSKTYSKYIYFKHSKPLPSSVNENKN